VPKKINETQIHANAVQHSSNQHYSKISVVQI